MALYFHHDSRIWKASYITPAIPNGAGKVQKVAKLSLGFWVTFGVYLTCRMCVLSGHRLVPSQNFSHKLSYAILFLCFLPLFLRYWRHCCWLMFWFPRWWSIDLRWSYLNIIASLYLFTTLYPRTRTTFLSSSWNFCQDFASLACPQDKAINAWKHCLLCRSGCSLPSLSFLHASVCVSIWNYKKARQNIFWRVHSLHCFHCT